MRRKALQGLANNLCQMFVGHQAYNDVQDILAPLSQGRRVVLEINMLTGQCVAEGEVLPLPIAGVMQGWLAEQMRRRNIPAEAILNAMLHVEYRAKLVKLHPGPLLLETKQGWHWQRRTLWERIASRLANKPPDFVLDVETEFQCRAVIQTSVREYVSVNGKSEKPARFLPEN